MTIPLIRKTSYKSLKQAELLHFTENVYQRMASKPEYKAYAADVSLLGQQLQEYREALARAINRGMDDVALKKEIRAQVLQTLDRIALDLNRDHNRLESWGVNAGMEVIQEKQRHTGELLQPYKLQVQGNGNRGEAILRFKMPDPRRVRSNNAQYSLDHGQTWHNGGYNTSSKIHLKELPSRQTIWFRVCSIGTAHRQSPWTEAVEMFVL